MEAELKERRCTYRWAIVVIKTWLSGGGDFTFGKWCGDSGGGNSQGGKAKANEDG